MDQLTCRETWVDDVAILGVAGELDMLTAPRLSDAIRMALSRKPAGLIIDLLDLRFLASAGMQVLLHTHDEITPETRFAVVADGPATSRPLKIVGITDVIDVYSTLDVAIHNLTESGAAPSLQS